MKSQIQSQGQIEIYVTVGGHVCVSQADSPEGESRVFIAPHNVDQVCSLLKKYKSQARQAWSDFISENENEQMMDNSN